MQGMYFAHIAPNPKDPGQIFVKTGVVKAAVGVGRWLLEFQGKGYNFSNVISAESLERFAFFDNVAARQAFISELLAQNAPPDEREQPVIEAAPEPASVQ